MIKEMSQRYARETALRKDEQVYPTEVAVVTLDDLFMKVTRLDADRHRKWSLLPKQRYVFEISKSLAPRYISDQ